MNGTEEQWEKEYRKERMREAKYMVQDYVGAKLRVKRYPLKRPTFFKQMSISLDNYENTGFIDYDTELEKHLQTEDAIVLHEYINDMLTVWLVERIIASTDNEITKQIAEDTIIKGKKCSDLEEKYGLKTRAIQARKRSVIKRIADCLG